MQKGYKLYECPADGEPILLAEGLITVISEKVDELIGLTPEVKPEEKPAE